MLFEEAVGEENGAGLGEGSPGRIRREDIVGRGCACSRVREEWSAPALECLRTSVCSCSEATRCPQRAQRRPELVSDEGNLRRCLEMQRVSLARRRPAYEAGSPLLSSAIPARARLTGQAVSNASPAVVPRESLVDDLSRLFERRKGQILGALLLLRLLLILRGLVHLPLPRLRRCRERLGRRSVRVAEAPRRGAALEGHARRGPRVRARRALACQLRGERASRSRSTSACVSSSGSDKVAHNVAEASPSVRSRAHVTVHTGESVKTRMGKRSPFFSSSFRSPVTRKTCSATSERLQCCILQEDKRCQDTIHVHTPRIPVYAPVL